MISEKENTRISKMLSLILRHKPETISLTLDDHGWASVSELLLRLNESGLPITFGVLEYVVASNSKSRFTFNDDKTKIRANQGHSVSVELGYDAQEPPDVLFHGTAERFLASIISTGISKQTRHHVHLSADIKTATAVGQRYGKPVVLRIRARDMFADGHAFYRTDNDVWLTDHVPVEYISPVVPEPDTL